MLIGIISVLMILVIMVLYGCIRTSTDYDKQVDDDMQEVFLRQYQKVESSDHKSTEANVEK